MEDSYQISRIEAINRSYEGIYHRPDIRRVTDEMIAHMTTRNYDHRHILNNMYYAPLMSTDSYATGRIHFGKNEGYQNVSKRPTQETLDELYDLFGWYYVDI
mgnify:FL=1